MRKTILTCWPLVTLTLGQDDSKSNIGRWFMSSPAVKFHNAMISSFWEILWNDRQTDAVKHSRLGDNNQMRRGNTRGKGSCFRGLSTNIPRCYRRNRKLDYRQLFGIHLLLNVSLKFNSQAINSKRVLGEKNSNARFVSLTKHRKSVICNLFVIKEDKCILLFIELSI